MFKDIRIYILVFPFLTVDILFPHAKYRKIQESFIQQAYSVIKNRGNFLAHAPTGIGKTAAVLSAALTYVLREDPSKTIFFLTSRNTQHLIAVDTLKALKAKYALQLPTADLIGKKGMCNHDGIHRLRSTEFIEFCRHARERGECPYYTKLFDKKNRLSPEAQSVLQKLKTESPLHVEEINSINRNADLCSYEMTTLLGKEAHVIIADYNYVLSPHIRGSLFSRIHKHLSNCILIFDEGHNVPGRAREIMSTRTNTVLIELAAREAEALQFEEVTKNLRTLRTMIEAHAHEKIGKDKKETLFTKKDLIDFVESLQNYEELMGTLVFLGHRVLEKKRRSFALSLAEFMERWLGPDDGFARIMKKESYRDKEIVSVSYRCLDPSLVLREILATAHATIFMSGTLTPLDMYADLFGADKAKTVTAEYDNPFPKENRLTVIVPETTTKYNKRSPMMYQAIAQKCATITSAIPGNAIVFFPSYRVLEDVYEYLHDLATKTLFLEEPQFTVEQRGALLERFKEYKDRGAVLLAVASGSFGEGIDLPGDYLKGVVIVGLPLAPPDLETQALIKYYDQRFGRGWEYGYITPAIIKSLQSAGRCIRSETDRGVTVFMDERYIWQSYRNCFSSNLHLKIQKNPAEVIEQFFSLPQPILKPESP